MKMFKLPTIIVITASVIIMQSCTSGGGNQSADQGSATEQEVSATAGDQQAEAAMMARGEEIYSSMCIACHQKDGKGIKNAFPSLIGSDFLLETPVMAAAQTLNGSEAFPSDEEKYPAPMPPQVDNKEDAVAVINYVLKTYNDSDIRITVEDMKDISIHPR